MPSTNDYPWSELGLDGSHATDRDVKRAYARLIKEHRPDTDPIGFQTVHAAYQCALEILKDLESTSVSTGSISDLPVETSAWSHSMQVAFDSLSEGLRADLNSAELQTKLYASWECLERENGQVGEWENVIQQIFADDETRLGELLAPNLVWVLWKRNANFLVGFAIQQWHQWQKEERLEQLAVLSLSDAQRADNEWILFGQLHLANALAFGNAGLANELLDRVFLKLTPDQRDGIFHVIQDRLLTAKLFQSVSTPTRRYWERKLIYDITDHTWGEPELKVAFEELANQFTSEWPGYGMLQAAMPQEVFSTLSTNIRLPDHLERKLHRKRTVQLFQWTFVIIAFSAFWLMSVFFQNAPKATRHDPVVIIQPVTAEEEAQAALGSRIVSAMALEVRALEELEAIPAYLHWVKEGQSGEPPTEIADKYRQYLALTAKRKEDFRNSSIPALR